MVPNKYVSGKNIIGKVYRDLNLQTEERFYDMFEWCYEALEFIGVPMQNIKKSCAVTIEDYKACLPLDMLNEIQVEYNGAPLMPHSGTFGVETTFSSNVSDSGVPSSVDNGLHDNALIKTKHYYEIVPGYIKTSFRYGEVNIAYYAMPVDKENYPLIPDEINYREACFWYIVYKLILSGHDHKRLDMGTAYQMWEKYCRQARSFANMPDLALLEKFKIQRLSLVPNVNAYSTFFENLNQYPKL